MPRNPTNRQYTVIKDIAIYLMLMPSGREIYIGKSEEKNLRGHYRDHYNLHKAQTKQIIEVAKKDGLRPKMYRLEDLETTETEAYRHIVAWVKYFMEHGYQSINHTRTNEYADDFMEETEAIYDQIKEIPISEIITEDRQLFPNYGEVWAKRMAAHEQKDDESDTKIGFRVTPEEAEKIRKLAAKKGVSVSKYARDTLLKAETVKVSFEFLDGYTKDLQKQSELVRRVIYTIHKTQNYTPSDLAIIQESADLVGDQASKIGKELDKIMRKAMKNIAAAQRKIK